MTFFADSLLFLPRFHREWLDESAEYQLSGDMLSAGRSATVRTII